MVDAVVLDMEVAPGSRFGAGGWMTDTAESRSGKEQRVKRRPTPRRRYELRYNARDKTEVQAVQAFIDDREGKFRGFLIRDWANYQLTDHLILTAAGGETTAQVKQIWGTGNQLSRTIRYLQSGTLVVKKNAATLTLTTDYTVNSAGLITFVSPLTAADAITVTCNFYVPVRFDVDEFFSVPTGPAGVHGVIESIPLIEVLE